MAAGALTCCVIVVRPTTGLINQDAIIAEPKTQTTHTHETRTSVAPRASTPQQAHPEEKTSKLHCGTRTSVASLPSHRRLGTTACVPSLWLYLILVFSHIASYSYLCTTRYGIPGTVRTLQQATRRACSPQQTTLVFIVGPVILVYNGSGFQHLNAKSTSNDSYI